MSQERVSQILENNYPLFLTYSQILGLCELSRRSVFKALKRLLHHNEIEYKISWGKKNNARWERVYRARRTK